MSCLIRDFMSLEIDLMAPPNRHHGENPRDLIRAVR